MYVYLVYGDIFFCLAFSLLKIRQNELKELPVEVGELVELRTLGVSSNRLESLPSALGQLVLLEFIFANGNLLRSVPSELAALPHLKKVRREKARRKKWGGGEIVFTFTLQTVAMLARFCTWYLFFCVLAGFSFGLVRFGSCFLL